MTCSGIRTVGSGRATLKPGAASRPCGGTASRSSRAGDASGQSAARTDDGRLRRDVAARAVTLELPGLDAGTYAITEWDPERGEARRTRRHVHAGGPLLVTGLPLATELALAVRPGD